MPKSKTPKRTKKGKVVKAKTPRYWGRTEFHEGPFLVCRDSKGKIIGIYTGDRQWLPLTHHP